MDPTTIVALASQVGLPTVAIVGAVLVIWRVVSKTLDLQHAAFRDRLADAIAERDHYRERAETADERVRRLAVDMIDELRTRQGRRRGEADEEEP